MSNSSFDMLKPSFSIVTTYSGCFEMGEEEKVLDFDFCFLVGHIDCYNSLILL